MDDSGAGASCAPQERVEHRLRAIGRGEELPRGLPFEGDSELLEEGDGPPLVELPEHLADRVARRAGVITRIDAIVCDVAAAASGDEYLGAELSGAVHHEDAAARRRAAGPDRRHEPRRPRADDDGVRVVTRIRVRK
jgi:hypothetical protein